MEMASDKEFNLYRDIQQRTGGEIYIGIVGPVRTGKSTFIKRFMDLMVLPNIEDENSRQRTVDELPQSAQGKTIMTTEPKFIPKDAAVIHLDKDAEVKVRLIDCVGYMVDGAAGHMEGNNKRMVKTPWFDYEIPFVDAASIGTQKVIKDHSTIGIVVTTDGSFGELKRDNYISAEEKTVGELKTLGKPFVIVLNSERPYSDETVKLAEQMTEKYQMPVIPVSCEQLRKDDINRILESILYEFPIVKMEFYIPKWAEMLPAANRMKENVIENARAILEKLETADITFNINNSHSIKTDLKDKNTQKIMRLLNEIDLNKNLSFDNLDSIVIDDCLLYLMENFEADYIPTAQYLMQNPLNIAINYKITRIASSTWIKEEINTIEANEQGNFCLPIGIFKIEVSAEGYKDIAFELEVTEEDTKNPSTIIIDDFVL